MTFTIDHDPREPETSLLDGLNPAQIEAAQQTEGPVLVLAGAGTGKTRVLTTRLAHLLQTGRAFPGQILAVTFTNKAAQEMKQRVSKLMGGAPVEGWWLGTFHSLAARLLRRDADRVQKTPARLSTPTKGVGQTHRHAAGDTGRCGADAFGEHRDR